MKSTTAIQISALTQHDVSELQELEEITNLCFWGVEHYKRFLAQQEYFGRKAELDIEFEQGKLVGFFIARAILENLELLKIGVYPGYQKQGIGARLLQAAFVEGLRRGCQRCFLEVRKSNQGAIQFYFDQNFKIAGERINYYTEPIEDAWIMERWL